MHLHSHLILNFLWWVTFIYCFKLVTCYRSVNFFKLIFYLKELQEEGETEKEACISWLISKVEARHQEFLSLQFEYRGPRTWAMLCCFLRLLLAGGLMESGAAGKWTRAHIAAGAVGRGLAWYNARPAPRQFFCIIDLILGGYLYPGIYTFYFDSKS